MKDPAHMSAKERRAEIAAILARACSRLRAGGAKVGDSANASEADVHVRLPRSRNSQNRVDEIAKVERSCERASKTRAEGKVA